LLLLIAVSAIYVRLHHCCTNERAMNETITIRLPDGERAKIEAIIKREYPRLKSISDVVRSALNDYHMNTKVVNARRRQKLKPKA
jgi:Arc/MetJ-type ribon-helix-helix transcriptional regulator